ncbi:hypothetical protein EDC01DRAFT_437545 [Geopyxis carbonaria]|nr:hypothetical protein EDC01DRAFT_437545 [Geopyxis carbonaria]
MDSSSDLIESPTSRSPSSGRSSGRAYPWPDRPSAVNWGTDFDDSTKEYVWPSERTMYASMDTNIQGTRIHFPPPRLSTPTTHRTQQAFARAVLATMPVEAREMKWKDGVTASLWGLERLVYPWDNLSTQLLRYNKMFGYLSRLYDAALALDSPLRIEQIVRRGREILAAIRLLGGQKNNHPPARGTEARNTSNVTIWGWLPYREMALADRVSERRRIRAMEIRERSRNLKRPRSFSLIPTEPEPEIVDKQKQRERRRSWTAEELRDSINRITKLAREQYGISDESFSKSESVDDCLGHKDECIRPIIQVQRQQINWNIPNYEDGFDVPTKELPFPLSDESGEDRWNNQSVKTAEKSPEETSIPYYLHRPPSESVSPRSTPTPSPYTTYKNTSAYESTSSDFTPLYSSSNESQKNKDYGKFFPKSPGQMYSSDETMASRSSSLRVKLKSFKNTTIPRIRRMPIWSSSSDEKAPSRSMSTTSSNGPLNKQHVPTHPRNEKSPSDSTNNDSQLAAHKLAQITLLNNTITTSEVFVPETSTIATTNGCEGEQELTRTEREYQEALEQIEKLKRELRMERDSNTRERRNKSRSRSRGRRIDREDTVRISAERSRSRDTVKKWLGDSR